MFKFTEAISLMITCRDQTEIDYYWNALTADGQIRAELAGMSGELGRTYRQAGRVQENDGDEKDQYRRFLRTRTKLFLQIGKNVNPPF